MNLLFYCMEMNSIMKVILDGKDIENREMVHIYLKERLGLPEYYGENLDALWDILSVASESISIELRNEEKLIDNLGYYGRSLLQVFKDLTHENTNIEFTIPE